MRSLTRALRTPTRSCAEGSGRSVAGWLPTLAAPRVRTSHPNSTTVPCAPSVTARGRQRSRWETSLGDHSHRVSRRPAGRQLQLRATAARRGRGPIRRIAVSSTTTIAAAATGTPARPSRTVASAARPTCRLGGRNTTAPAQRPARASSTSSQADGPEDPPRLPPAQCGDVHHARHGIAVLPDDHLSIAGWPRSKQAGNAQQVARAAHPKGVTTLRPRPRPKRRPHFAATAVRGTREPSPRTAGGTGRCRHGRRRGRSPTRRSAVAEPGRPSSSTEPSGRSRRWRRARAGG